MFVSETSLILIDILIDSFNSFLFHLAKTVGRYLKCMTAVLFSSFIVGDVKKQTDILGNCDELV